MKKTKLWLLPLCAFSILSFIGCKPVASDNSDTGKSINADFRNKAANGSVFAGRSIMRAADDGGLNQEFIKLSENNIKIDGVEKPLTEDEAKKIITFDDSAAGIKVKFNTPQEWVDKEINLNFFKMYYIEESGAWSTQATIDESVGNENKIIKKEFSFEYPLVLPEKTTTFIFQFGGENYKTPESKIWLDFSLKVTPKHGTARVDNLPENWNDHDSYTEFKNGVMILKNIIPPEAQKVTKNISVVFKTSDHMNWQADSKELKPIEESIEYGQKTDFYIGDIKTIDYYNNELDLTDYTHCHIGMTYQYKIKNFDTLTFSTPEIATNNIASTFFKTPVAERKVSETVIENNKVSFDGDGYFDGLYEGDIKVNYGGEEFIPAVFVEGLNVYILSVKDGVYTAKAVKTIREYLEEGGSFNNENSSDGKIYTKLKTDTSEANIFKTDVSEITFTGSF